MSRVEKLWEKTYRAPLYLFGIPFFLIGLIFLVNDGSLGFILNGVLWVTIGLGIKLKCVLNQRKLVQLRMNGVCYDGSAVRAIPSHYIRVGNYVTARLECTYQTDHGECSILTGYHLLSPFEKTEGLICRIYVDRTDSKNYSVEVFRN